jgi:hypothetical protein
MRAFTLLPATVETVDQSIVAGILDYYKHDLPSPATFQQEFKLWKHMWSSQDSKPDNLSDILSDNRSCVTMYPNITTIIHLLLLTSVISSSVERANSSFEANPKLF